MERHLPDTDAGLDSAIDALLALPCSVIDALPRRVPAERGPRFFETARFLLTPPRGALLRERFALTLLTLNCYYDMQFFTMPGLRPVESDAPEALEKLILADDRELYAVTAGREALLTLDAGDTCIALYTVDQALRELAGELARAQGLFLWDAHAPSSNPN